MSGQKPTCTTVSRGTEMKAYITEDDGYFRVNIETELVTYHKFHSEKLSKINAQRLLERVNQAINNQTDKILEK